jgi:hypothetical protein
MSSRWNELPINDADTEDYFGPGSDSEDQLDDFTFATMKHDMRDYSGLIYKALLVDGNSTRSWQLFRQFSAEHEACMDSLISRFTSYRDEGLAKMPGLQSAAAEVIVASNPTNEPTRSSRVSQCLTTSTYELHAATPPPSVHHNPHALVQ